ncbi:MAG: DUF3795 domain-containing protein [Candidatus Lokiarchaeota archaeon]|nr:DUF3795 domain-containing protein [Candidatus Lokiarchaeota archaeon]
MKNNQKINEKKQQKIAVCGLDCGNCDIYNASNNPEIAHQLVKQFDGAWEDVKAEDFHCNGCRGDITKCWTLDCWIRECCVNNKNLEYCYECQEFPCIKLKKWANKSERYGNALNQLKKMKV